MPAKQKTRQTKPKKSKISKYITTQICIKREGQGGGGQGLTFPNYRKSNSSNESQKIKKNQIILSR